MAQLTFHEAGWGKKGWFEKKIAPILRDGRLGEYGKAERLTFRDLEKLIEDAREAKSKEVMLAGRGKGGQRLVNLGASIEEIRHAINNGRQVMEAWQEIHARSFFRRKRKRKRRNL